LQNNLACLYSSSRFPATAWRAWEGCIPCIFLS